MPLLTSRALNRALLARQHLLDRVDHPVADVVEHLVGLQAQEPPDPYVALWSRIGGFAPAQLGDLLEERAVVRAGLMRGTIHLVTARDCHDLRALVGEMLAKVHRTTAWAKALDGVDLAEIVTVARDVLAADGPLSRKELSVRLAERWPDRDADSLGYTATYLLPVVQTPPRGVWGKTGIAKWAVADDWLGAGTASLTVDDLVLRYLRAFGPATVADMRTWSRLTDLRAAFDRVQDQLVQFEDDRGRTLYDVPDAPRPDADTPAPPRFLPQYDNLVLSHDDRSRVVPEGFASPGWVGHFLVDGMLHGTWSIKGRQLTVTPQWPLAKRDQQAVEAEATALSGALYDDVPVILAC